MTKKQRRERDAQTAAAISCAFVQVAIAIQVYRKRKLDPGDHMKAASDLLGQAFTHLTQAPAIHGGAYNSFAPPLTLTPVITPLRRQLKPKVAK